jgi:serine/threonine protein phosphatase PrpC
VPDIFRNLFGKKSSKSKTGGQSGEFSQSTSPVMQDTNLTTVEARAFSSIKSVSRLETPQILVGIGQSVGVQRQTNEDSLYTLTSSLNFNGDIKNFGIYIIADGMGGHENGEVASRIAIEKMSSYVVSKLYLPSISTDTGHFDESIQEVLREGVIKAHQAIKHAANGSGTTLTAALIIGDKLSIAHVGDSRAYLIEPDWRVKLLTHDHSLVKRLEEIGQLTPEEASKNPRRNLLYRAVGQGDQIDPDVTTYHIFNGQMLMLCTDGLWGVLSENDLIQVLQISPEPQIVCQSLIEAANAAGGPDNISVILINFPS